MTDLQFRVHPGQCFVPHFGQIRVAHAGINETLKLGLLAKSPPCGPSALLDGANTRDGRTKILVAGHEQNRTRCDQGNYRFRVEILEQVRHK